MEDYTPLKGTPPPLPIQKPPFTLKDLKDAIPPHCFQRSLVTSIVYTIHNIVVCVGLFYLATWIEYLTRFIPIPYAHWLPWVIWPGYWFLQGCYMFGLWILAHECGHGSFSDYPLVNDFVGVILHSFLLMPYHSWRLTHKKHHLNTGSAENEEVHVPRTRTWIKPYWNDILEDSPIYNFIGLLSILPLGLLPLYLVFNLTGPLKYKGKNVNHFSPSAVMFQEKDRNGIIISNIVYFGWVAAIMYFCYRFGPINVFLFYGGPQIVTNALLVIITLLQHTDTYIPHFREGQWNWMHGSLCTVDRSFGTWLDSVFHHISDTHVLHHLFSKIPFYHAQEATEHISKVLGKYRMVDDTPILKALWRAYCNCKFVEDEGGAVFYKKSFKSDNGYDS